MNSTTNTKKKPTKNDVKRLIGTLMDYDGEFDFDGNGRCIHHSIDLLIGHLRERLNDEDLE